MMASKAERASSFGSVADAYDRFRPPLPLEVAAACGVGPGTRVLDLAAGTGLATRTFEAAGAVVTAVEPDPAMLAVLSAKSPNVTALRGTAEAIPLDDERVDLVAVCSAWHWFDVGRAGPEIARVLAEDGQLLICWNGLDQRIPWVAQFAALRDSTSSTDDLGDRFGHSPAAVAVAGLPFDAPRTETTSWTWRRQASDLVAMLATYSGIITMAPAAREAVLQRGRALLVDHADADGMVEVPMAARTWLARRQPRDLRS